MDKVTAKEVQEVRLVLMRLKEAGDWFPMCKTCYDKNLLDDMIFHLGNKSDEILLTK